MEIKAHKMIVLLKMFLWETTSVSLSSLNSMARATLTVNDVSFVLCNYPGASLLGIGFMNDLAVRSLGAHCKWCTWSWRAEKLKNFYSELVRTVGESCHMRCRHSWGDSSGKSCCLVVTFRKCRSEFILSIIPTILIVPKIQGTELLSLFSCICYRKANISQCPL